MGINSTINYILLYTHNLNKTLIKLLILIFKFMGKRSFLAKAFFGCHVLALLWLLYYDRWVNSCMFFWPQTLENGMVCHRNITVDILLFAVLKFSVPYLVHTTISDSFIIMNIASHGDKNNFLWTAAIARPIFKEKSNTDLSV